MYTLKGPILPEGALVDVLVGLAEADCQALRSAGRPVPVSQRARALIDIGADMSCATGSGRYSACPRLAHEVGKPPCGKGVRRKRVKEAG
jgi:hypothetical protein